MAAKKPAAKSAKTVPRRTPRITAKTAAKQPVSTSGAAATRRVKPPRRRFWRRQDKRFRPIPAKLPGSWRITKDTYRLLAGHWKLVGGMLLVYGVLTVLLVRGLSGSVDVSSLKQSLGQVFHGDWGHLTGGLTVFGILLTSSGGTASDAAGVYQLFLVLMVSLALVWSFRRILAAPGGKLRIRDGFYQGMYPFVPVVLVLIVVGLQLIPAVLGGAFYSVVTSGGIAVTAPEQLSCLAIFIVLAAVSVYMLCSSLFALYIATLPDMTPLKALRSARGLVKYRRWPVIRKLLFLLLILLVCGACIMVPFILFAAVVAEWIFFILTVAAVAVVNAYMYTLYRSLLDE
ncbi:MAG TPA: hypothetical protein VF261_02340 [Candidatus Saccharimonadales bacterium]